MYQLYPILVALLSAAPAAPQMTQVLGRTETCLVCHKTTQGLGTYHAPESIGCSSCHGGDASTTEKARSHAGMRLIPGNLADAPESCGAAGCHPDAPAHVRDSLMATMAGVVAIDRLVFGETHAAPHAVTALTHSPADSHLRTLCASCHLGAPKTQTGPISQESRGGGCNACHLNYESKKAISKAARAGEATLVHPALRVQAGDNHCFGCHSRSGRIALSFAGMAEVMRPYPKGAKLATLDDGRKVRSMPADVHAKNMQCIDCHPVGEVMGSGVRHAAKSEALTTACADCHTAAPLAASFAELTPEEQRIAIVRGWETDSLFVRGRSGANLPGTSIVAGAVTTLPRAGGTSLSARAPSSQCSAPAHERLTCESCHSAWAPRCNGCHTRYDAQVEGYDLFEDKPVRGDWLETPGDYRADAPTLGVRKAKRGGEEITPFVPGMILQIDGRAPRRLFSPLAPHTISRKARTCESCHTDPQAFGFGRGKLSYASAGGTGVWRFDPAAKTAADGLPADAWIGFLTGTGGDTLRPGTRAFTVEEQNHILRAGACLTCHAAASTVMTAYLADPLSHRNRTGPQCSAPVPQGAVP